MFSDLVPLPCDSFMTNVRLHIVLGETAPGWGEKKQVGTTVYESLAGLKGLLHGMWQSQQAN